MCAACSYVDKWRYLESGQEKKKGFLTSDFSKRDEFSNTTRTLQWREQLAVSTHTPHIRIPVMLPIAHAAAMITHTYNAPTEYCYHRQCGTCPAAYPPQLEILS